MARATHELVQALRIAVDRLSRQDVQYRWSDFAHCNCGHLVQAATGRRVEDIQRRALGNSGDWGEQAQEGATTWNRPAAHPRPDYGDRPALDEGAWEPENVGLCSATGSPLDVVFDELSSIGLEPEDMGHLERLSDPKVRKAMGNNTEYFLHYERENVIRYMRAWADQLERELDDVPSAIAAE